MTDDDRARWTGLIFLRNNEVTLRGASSQLFLLIHSGGLTLALTQYFQHRLPPSFLSITGALGIVLGVLWLATIMRANQLIAFWHAQLKGLEQLPSAAEAFKVFSSDVYENIAKSRITITRSMLFLAGIFIAIWFVIVVVSFFL